MGLIVSIETATKICSVALHQDGILLQLAELHEEYSHFEKLPALLDKIFQQAGKKMIELSAVAVSKGPGSFTGLRIGVSMAKGLAYSLNIPLISVGTLKGMAITGSQKARSEELLCPMIDARRSEVYCMLVDTDLNPIWNERAVIVNENSFEKILLNHKLLLFGDGSQKFLTLFESIKKIRFENILPSARTIGTIAWDKYQKKDFENKAYFEPYYLKDFKPGITKKNVPLN